MKLLLVVNPSASTVTAAKRSALRQAIEAEHDVTEVETTRRDHANEIGAGAAGGGYDLVVIYGGDGTLNEVVNGIARSAPAGSAASLPAVAPLPGGSTNVFSRTLGFTNKSAKAAERLIAALRSPERAIRSVGLGKANDRHFVFNAGLGFDAAVVEMVERHSSLKRKLGHPLYVYATVSTFVRHFDRKHPHFDVTLADGRQVRDGYFAICLNSNPYTFLGAIPLQVAPEAGFDTALSMVVFQRLTLPALLGVNLAAMTGRAGTKLAERKKIQYASNVGSIRVQGKRPFMLQMDGEYLGQVESVELSHQPDVVRFVVPKLLD